jgi:hypothetical protein
MIKYIFLLSIFIFLTGCSRVIIPDTIVFDQTSFVKPLVNPILSADSTYKFFDSILMKSIAWQKADVFNPLL